MGLDLLLRFGEELIAVVEYLEREGVPHRDIKPDNIGIRPGAGKRLTLTLFDFSLAGVPATDLNAGTRVYMDPFLRKRGAWDGYAERYSCALTLHEMATGTLPKWGDGSADPATLNSEILLDSERFDASIRQGGAASSSAEHSGATSASVSTTPSRCSRRGVRSSKTSLDR